MAAGVFARAGNGVVGPGNCDEDGFGSVLSAVDNGGGGTITFDCGTTTIGFTGYKQIAHAVTIDGGGTITIDGGGTSAFFQVFSSANVTLKRLTLRHGAFSASHALENFGTLVLDTVRVQDNSASEAPVVNYRNLYVRRSTFSGNQTTSPGSGDGGAIAHSGDVLVVDSSTFVNNRSAGRGGAIYGASSAWIVNSTFNLDTAAAGGGAVYQDGGDAHVDHVTIVGNTSTAGAALQNAAGSGTLTVGRSLVAANNGNNCGGTLATGGYNVSDGGGCNGAFMGPGDLISLTLPLGALADNGGPTQTMLPLSGNPVIDRIPTGACAIPADQRGAGRPFGPGCDSGAVEVGGSPFDSIFHDGFDF
jgi:predicted outer membrane repeat protein